MINRRHQAGGRRTRRELVPAGRNNDLPAVYLGRTKGSLPEIYLPDPGESRHGSKFKWLVSTIIAGAVGLCSIGMVMYASMDMEDGSGVVNSITRASIAALKPFKPSTISGDNLRVAKFKTDRIKSTSKGLSTKHIIHDSIVQSRGGREFISIKPYAKVVARLSTQAPGPRLEIPPLNPFKLYANATPISAGQEDALVVPRREITVKVVELLGGILPNEDGQELGTNEISEIVSEAAEIYGGGPYAIRPAILPEDANGGLQFVALKTDPTPKMRLEQDQLPRNTTVIVKSVEVEEEAPEHREVKVVKVKRGDSLVRLIRTVGAENWQAKAITEAMNPVYPAKSIRAGQEIRFTLVPAASDTGQLEPIAISLYSGSTHEVTVLRNDAGEYEATTDTLDLAISDILRPSQFPQRATIYKSLYQAAIAQNIPSDRIMQILRIHAYDSDFKRLVQPGDSFEAFFDLKDEDKGEDAAPGELLYTSIMIGGQIRRFYRYRTPDGVVDYYDDKGSSSKKFLMRKPVRGARYTSGFGYRRHPLLGVRKMHKGVDWASPQGTPILAAGNGTVEVVGRKGGHGNYIRLRHANGYKTTYSHLYRYAAGLQPGIKVRQGQVVGYVGSTGLSSGPHLHFEVLVNNRHVDPMKIEVPRGKELKGRLLADFQKERARIDELMRRSPVKTRVAQATKKQ